MKLIGTGGVALSTLAFLVSASGALALDGEDFATKFSAMLAYSNSMPVAYESATTAGDTVTLKGMSITAPGETEKMKLPADVVFTGVSETNDGGYTVNEARVTDIEVTEQGMTFSMKDVVLSQITVPATPTPRAMIGFYQRFAVGPVSVTVDGSEVFRMSDASGSSIADADGRYVGEYTVNGIHADLSSIDDPQATGMLALFGLTEINGRAFGDMNWNVETGRMQIETSKIELTDVGGLNVAMDIGGYDMEVLGALLESQRKLAAVAPGDYEALEAMNAEMGMVMMRKISLHGASIRFDDDSITGKVLDFFAAQQGGNREVMVAGLSGMAPAMAAQFGLPAEMQSTVAEAATKFLSDPQNLEIRLAPEKPVMFTDITAIGEDPAALATLFNLSVVANQ